MGFLGRKTGTGKILLKVRAVSSVFFFTSDRTAVPLRRGGAERGGREAVAGPGSTQNRKAGRARKAKRRQVPAFKACQVAMP